MEESADLTQEQWKGELGSVCTQKSLPPLKLIWTEDVSIISNNAQQCCRTGSKAGPCSKRVVKFQRGKIQ